MIDLLCRRCGFQSDAQIAAVRAGWEGNIGGIEKYRGNESLNNAYYAGAVGGGHLSIVERLLEQGASPDAGLRFAVHTAQENMVSLMKQRGADIRSCLHVAANDGNLTLVKLLLEGVEKTSLGIGNMALYCAAERG